MEYYNSNIQLMKDVCEDIVETVIEKSKDVNEKISMLVWGLGYDSVLWNNIPNVDVYFIEDNIKFIELNKGKIENDKMIYYEYPTETRESMNYTEKTLSEFKKPEIIFDLPKFDIILIDGPQGNTFYHPNLTSPGRILPLYWSKELSKKGTIIYIDDVHRCVETHGYKFYNYPIIKAWDDRKRDPHERFNTIKCCVGAEESNITLFK